MSDDKKNNNNDDDLDFEGFEDDDLEDIEEIQEVEDIPADDLDEPLEAENPDLDDEALQMENSSTEEAAQQPLGDDTDIETAADFDDEFDDDLEGLEEDAVDLETDEDFYEGDEDDWEGQEDDSEYEEMGKPQPKKKGGLSRVVIVGTFVALAGGGYYFLFGLPQSTAPATQPTQQQMDPSQAQMAQQQEPVGFLRNPDELSQDATGQAPQPAQGGDDLAALPQPAPIPNTPEAKQGVIAQQQAQPEPPDQLPAPEPTMPEPDDVTQQSAPVAETVVPQPQPAQEAQEQAEPAPPQVTPQQAQREQAQGAAQQQAQNTEIDRRIAEGLRQDISELRDRSQAMEQQMQNVASQLQSLRDTIASSNQSSGEKASAQTPTDAVSTSELSQVKNSLNRLENKVTSLENKLASLPAQRAQTPAQTTQTTSAEKTADAKARPVQKMQARGIDNPPTPAQKPAPPQVASDMTEKKLEDVVANIDKIPDETGIEDMPPPPEKDILQQKWVLRAAQPDRAWLSPEGRLAELKEVVVGDRVQGLGRIQAIELISGKWVVKGSQAVAVQ